jgi:hypothetical protein
MPSAPQNIQHNTKWHDYAGGFRSECGLSEVLPQSLLGRPEENDEKHQSGYLISVRDLPNTNLGRYHLEVKR